MDEKFEEGEEIGTVDFFEGAGFPPGAEDFTSPSTIKENQLGGATRETTAPSYQGPPKSDGTITSNIAEDEILKEALWRNLENVGRHDFYARLLPPDTPEEVAAGKTLATAVADIAGGFDGWIKAQQSVEWKDAEGNQQLARFAGKDANGKPLVMDVSYTDLPSEEGIEASQLIFFTHDAEAAKRLRVEFTNEVGKTPLEHQGDNVSLQLKEQNQNGLNPTRRIKAINRGGGNYSIDRSTGTDDIRTIQQARGALQALRESTFMGIAGKLQLR